MQLKPNRKPPPKRLPKVIDKDSSSEDDGDITHIKASKPKPSPVPPAPPTPTVSAGALFLIRIPVMNNTYLSLLITLKHCLFALAWRNDDCCFTRNRVPMYRIYTYGRVTALFLMRDEHNLLE